MNNPHEHSEDPIIESHEEEADVAFDEDLESIKTVLRATYPSPDSAIDDYRKGYISERKLRLRFTDEEMEYIFKEKEERDRDDSSWSSSSVL
jgi:hypothetical protein